VTYKAIDPGVKTLLSCCTLFVEEDVRTTKYAVSSKEYHEMIKSAMRRCVTLELSKRVLSEDVYERLKVLSSKAAVDESYEEYLNYVQKHLPLILELQNHTKLKKLRFLGFCLRKKAIAKIANELARPRPGHEKTILILGDGCRNGGFSGARGHARGPTNAIFHHIQLHKLAITVWQDEFRTSALSITGHIARHPRERKTYRLLPKRCKCNSHGPDVPGCKCFCSVDGCTNRRTHSHKCRDHHSRDPVTIYGLIVDGNGRIYDRDVSASLNIACAFFASLLGLKVHRWKRHTLIDEEEEIGWSKIFRDGGVALPFNLYSKNDPSWPHPPKKKQQIRRSRRIASRRLIPSAVAVKNMQLDKAHTSLPSSKPSIRNCHAHCCASHDPQVKVASRKRRRSKSFTDCQTARS
jgi:hypothetical protein